MSFRKRRKGDPQLATKRHPLPMLDKNRTTYPGPIKSNHHPTQKQRAQKSREEEPLGQFNEATFVAERPKTVAALPQLHPLPTRMIRVQIGERKSFGTFVDPAGAERKRNRAFKTYRGTQTK